MKLRRDFRILSLQVFTFEMSEKLIFFIFPLYFVIITSYSFKLVKYAEKHNNYDTPPLEKKIKNPSKNSFLDTALLVFSGD